MAAPTTELLNGISAEAIGEKMEQVRCDPAQAKARFHVTTCWSGGPRSETCIDGWSLGGEELPKSYSFHCDEPRELFGTNTAPNPQEYLMGAFNACMLASYVAGASLSNIELESLEIETEGELDIRGFLGVDPAVPPGYEELRYTVRIKGNGTDEQFRAIHEMVTRTSPNRWNISQPISLESQLIIE